jgi:hypothetical protein
MRPIAIFYHCLLNSQHRNIDHDYAIKLITTQMAALKESGLEEAAQHFCIGVNGNEHDAFAVAMMSPDKATVIHHGAGVTTEIPTLNILRAFAQQHPGWAILYHHTKGVSTPNQQDGWRCRMEHGCVWNWQACVRAITEGTDAAGCHWLTPEQHPGSITSPFFGGNFWWASSEHITRLPPLPEATWQNRYEAEAWIGRSVPRPRVVDFYPGWPTVH